MDEEGVRESAFDLILAFDEVLAMGHRETINLQQVCMCVFVCVCVCSYGAPRDHQSPAGLYVCVCVCV